MPMKGAEMTGVSCHPVIADGLITIRTSCRRLPRTRSWRLT